MGEVKVPTPAYLVPAFDRRPDLVQIELGRNRLDGLGEKADHVDYEGGIADLIAHVA